PTGLRRLCQGFDLVLVVDVHLQDFGRRFHPAGTLFGQAHGPPEAGEHDVGPLLLGLVGDGEGDTGGGQHPGDQDLLPLENHRVSSSCRRFLNSSLSISPRAQRSARVATALTRRTDYTTAITLQRDTSTD